MGIGQVVRLLRIIRLIKMWQYRRLREAKVTQLKRLTERRRKALLRSVAADDPEAAAALLNANAAELDEMASQVRRLSTVRTIDSATTAKAVRNVMNRRRTRRRQSLALSLRDLKAKMQELQGDTTTKSRWVCLGMRCGCWLVGAAYSCMRCPQQSVQELCCTPNRGENGDEAYCWCDLHYDCAPCAGVHVADGCCEPHAAYVVA